MLVIEWLDGVSLRAAGQLIDDRGLDRAKLTRALLRSMVYQITGIAAALLLGVGGGPKITSDISLAQLIGYNLLIVAAILVLRVLYTIFMDR